MKKLNKEDSLKQLLFDYNIVPQSIWFESTFGWQAGGWFITITDPQDPECDLDLFLGRDYDAAVENIRNKHLIHADEWFVKKGRKEVLYVY